MKLIAFLIIVAALLLAAGFSVKLYKEKSQAALAAAMSAKAREVATPAKEKPATPAVLVELPTVPAPKRSEMPAPKETSNSALHRLLAGEVPAYKSDAISRMSATAQDQPNLARLLAATTSSDNR